MSAEGASWPAWSQAQTCLWSTQPEMSCAFSALLSIGSYPWGGCPRLEMNCLAAILAFARIRAFDAKHIRGL